MTENKEVEWNGSATELTIKLLRLKTENPAEFELVKQMYTGLPVGVGGPKSLIGAKWPIEFEPGVKTLVPLDQLLAVSMGVNVVNIWGKAATAARWLIGGS
jgi:hypothetical protein